MLLFSFLRFLPLLQASTISVGQFADILKEDNYCLPRSASEEAINHIKKALMSAFDEADLLFKELMIQSLTKEHCASKILPLCFYRNVLIRNNSRPNMQQLMEEMIKPIGFQNEILNQFLQIVTENVSSESLQLYEILSQLEVPLEALELLMKIDAQPLVSTDELFERLLRLSLARLIAISLKQKSYEELRIRARLLALESKELILLYQQGLSSKEKPTIILSNNKIQMIEGLDEDEHKHITRPNEGGNMIETSYSQSHEQVHDFLKDEQLTVLRSLILNDYVFPNLQEVMPKDLNHLSITTLNQALISSLTRLGANEESINQASKMINQTPNLQFTCQLIDAIQSPFLPQLSKHYYGYGMYAPFSDTITSRLQRIVDGSIKHSFKPKLLGNFKEFKTETCQFKDFMILEKIGSGSYGQVFKARHENGKEYALKVFVSEGISSKTNITNSLELEEGILSSKLAQHPNIGKLYCSMLAPDNAAILVMELYRGGNLIKFYENFKGNNKEDMIIKHAFQILDALKYLHERGLVHLDVKPENMVVDENGIAHLIDFGIAKKIDQKNKFSCLSGISFTTQAIRSPEQVLEKDNRCIFGLPVDLFGLGISLYYMAVMKPPYDNEKLPHRKFIEGLVEGKIKIPSTGLDKVDYLISLLTIINPTERYETIFGEDGRYYEELGKKFFK